LVGRIDETSTDDLPPPDPEPRRKIMPSELTTELTASPSENREAVLSIEVSEDDLLGLQVLGAVAGLGERDSDSFAELLRSTFHRGVIETYKSAGFAWPADHAGPTSEPAAASGHEKRRDGMRGGRRRVQVLRNVALWTAAAAAAILIIGSYAGHWTWTGLSQNGQVWDWMQLLVLPVAIGTFPLWLRFSGEMSPARRKALGGAVIAFAAFVVVGYVAPLRWTGFRGHTLWSWLTLLVLPMTVAGGTVWPKLGRISRSQCLRAAGALGVAWIVTLVGGYAGGWAWTGYPGNTLWEWVQLLLAPIAITTFVVPELIATVSGHVGDGGESKTAPGAPAAAGA
jgi:uncharacterized membrane protein